LEKIKVQFLLKEYRKGNNAALEELMLLTYKNLYSLAYSYVKDHMLAEDAISETYMKLIEKIDTIKNDKNLNGYLRTIVINKSLDILRKRKKEFCMEDEILDSQPEKSSTNMDSQYVKYILSKIPSAQREVLLYWQYGYTLRETAQKTGYTINQIRLLLDKAKKTFFEKYHKNKADETLY